MTTVIIQQYDKSARRREMHHEDNIKIFIMENICYKRKKRIDDEEMENQKGIKPDIHTGIHKK